MKSHGFLTKYFAGIEFIVRICIVCIEEIAWRRGFITTEQLKEIGNELKMTDYGQYLLSIAGEK